MAAMRLILGRARSLRLTQLLRILDADAFPRRSHGPVVLDKYPRLLVEPDSWATVRRLAAAARPQCEGALVRAGSQHKLPNGAQPVLP